MAVHVDVLTEFDNRSAMNSANDLQRSLQRVGDQGGRALSSGIVPHTEKVTQALSKVADASGKASAAEAKRSETLQRSEQITKRVIETEKSLEKLRGVDHVQATKIAMDMERELTTLRERQSSVNTKLVQDTERLNTARRNEANLLRDTTSMVREAQQASEAAGTTLTQLGSSIGALGRVAGPAGIAALAAGIVDLAGVASAASGAIGLLPGVIGGAASAFGTLKLATIGFGDAMNSVNDPEKFAAALSKLAPNAQQAALAIQQLMPAFRQLQQATQNELFANVGPQLQGLVNTLMPTIRQATTGIAGALNEAFMGATNALTAPETQAALKSFVDNVTQAFHALAPAAAPLTQAFATLASASSSVMPALAQGATELAQQFSTFITQVTKSGEFQEWLRTGLATLKQFGPIVTDVATMFLKLAPVGERIMPDIVSAVHNMAQILPPMLDIIMRIPAGFQTWTRAIDMAVNALKPMVSVLSTIMDAFGLLGTPQERAERKLAAAQLNASMGIFPNGGGGGFFGGIAPGGANIPLPMGTPGLGSAFMGGSSSMRPQPYTWGNPAPKSGSGSGSGLPQATAVPYDRSLPAGYAGLPQTAEIVSAENAWMDARHTLAEKRARVNQLEKDNNATENDRIAARNDVVNAEQAQQQAELRLADARQNLYEKNNKQLQGFASQMGDIGAQLDADLGISKGLPGLADNLVRFLASLAAAPLLGQLSATSQIAQAQGGPVGGFGLIGQLGAQGAFGPQYTYGQQQGYGGYGPSALGPAGLLPGGAPGLPAPVANTHGAHPQIAQIAAIAKSFGLEFTAGKDDHSVDGGYHPKGMAGDFSNSSGNSPQELAFAQYMADNFGPYIQELIYSDPNFNQLIGGGKNVTGTGYYSPGVLGEHTNHVHVAMTDQAAASLSGMSTYATSGSIPTGPTGPIASFGAPGSKQAIANMIYQQALSRGYSPHEAQSILAYAIGESGLNPGSSGGIQGGGGDPFADTVQGLFQQKPAFAQGGGISPGQRTDPVANTTAYLNQLEKHRDLPIEQALPATSVGGPLAPGGYQPWGPLMAQAGDYIGAGGGAGGWGGPGLPAGISGGGGLGPVWGANPAGPGLGGSAQAGLGPTGPMAGGAAGTAIQSFAPAASPGGGGGGIGITPGGTIDTAMQLGGAALDVLAPGAGQAAQTGMKLANRAIQFGGQVAGIAVGGLMETFLPHGSEGADPGKSWIGRIAAGVAGARPALPNMAQKKAPPPGQPPGSPASGQGSGPPPGPSVVMNQPTFNGSDHSVANEINRHQGWMYSK